MNLASVGESDRKLVADALTRAVSRGWRWGAWFGWTRVTALGGVEFPEGTRGVSRFVLPVEMLECRMLNVTDGLVPPLRFYRWAREGAAVVVFGRLHCCYVLWQPPAPRYTHVRWEVERAYSRGEVVLWLNAPGATVAAGDGNVWECVSETGGATGSAAAVGSPDYWRVSPVPEILWREAAVAAHVHRSRG